MMTPQQCVQLLYKGYTLQDIGDIDKVTKQAIRHRIIRAGLSINRRRIKSSRKKELKQEIKNL